MKIGFAIKILYKNAGYQLKYQELSGRYLKSKDGMIWTFADPEMDFLNIK